MRFCFHPVLLLGFLLFSLHCHAAELVSPASSVSSASVAPVPTDKTAYIDAQIVVGKKDAQIEAFGNVEMQQGSQKIFADHMIYQQNTGDLYANGAVLVEQPSGELAGPEFTMNTNTHVSEMPTAVFKVNKTDQSGSNNQNIPNAPNNRSSPGSQNQARGSALLVRSTGPSYYIFNHATYTTCPAGNDDWFIHMSEFDMDRSEAQTGTAYNAWVEFEGVPLLYTPWMTFPLDGARHTGILAPIYGNTTMGGPELTIPFYWNMAPNYDLTIAPRDMTKRGVMVQNEFRLLEPSSSLLIHYDDIGHDQVTGTSRYNARLMGTQNFGNGVSGALNLNRVSDITYFQDLSIAMADVTQTQLLNEGTLKYAGGGVTATVRAQSYQTLLTPQTLLSSPLSMPYQMLPQVTVAYQKNIDDAAINMQSEYVDFLHPVLAEGQRMVLYPSVTYSLLNDPGFYLKPKFGVNYTQYGMGANNTTNIPDATRTIPIFSVDSGMTFERDMTLGQSEFVQTLEPRLYYVNIPYQNQDSLPIFDTSPAMISFAQLFSENRFYGNDRIGDAKATTVGLTTRFIDSAAGIERLHIGVAERFYYSVPQVNLVYQAPILNQTLLLNQPPAVNQVTPNLNAKSDILLSIGGKITNALTLDSLLDYSPNKDTTLPQTSNLSITYRPELGKLLNLGYTVTNDPVYSYNDVRQLDISAQWPLIRRWNAVSRISYSLQQNLMTEKLIGLEYNRSCWMLRFITEQFWYSATFSSTAMYLQLELNDLVSLGTNPIDELRLQIPGYTKMNDAKLPASAMPAPVSP